MSRLYIREIPSTQLGDWWDAVDEGEEYAPLCTFCEEETTRTDCIEVLLEGDLGVGETPQNTPDAWLAGHRTCVEKSGLITVAL